MTKRNYLHLLLPIFISPTLITLSDLKINISYKVLPLLKTLCISDKKLYYVQVVLTCLKHKFFLLHIYWCVQTSVGLTSVCKFAKRFLVLLKNIIFNCKQTTQKCNVILFLLLVKLLWGIILRYELG